MSTISILGANVSITSYEHACGAIQEWADRGESRYVCVAPVHTLMEAYDSVRFKEVVNGADLVTPDGMPVVWALQLLGHKRATRVYGPDLTPAVLAMAAKRGIPVGFYGASPPTLRRLLQVVTDGFPGLKISYFFSPPYRPLTEEEDKQVTEEIKASGARILFVGMGAPKQDYWTAAHKGQISAVMIGVGAAFDCLAGAKPQAPVWMRNSGLEWVFRFATEPARLGRRYLKHNPRFAWLLTMQLFGVRSFSAKTEGARG